MGGRVAPAWRPLQSGVLTRRPLPLPATPGSSAWSSPRPAPSRTARLPVSRVAALLASAASGELVRAEARAPGDWPGGPRPPRAPGRRLRSRRLPVDGSNRGVSPTRHRRAGRPAGVPRASREPPAADHPARGCAVRGPGDHLQIPHRGRAAHLAGLGVLGGDRGRAGATAARAVPQHRVLAARWHAAAHRRLTTWDDVYVAAASARAECPTQPRPGTSPRRRSARSRPPLRVTVS